ncbi:MAG TPA: arylsulfotransferase family protein [Solirubrobacteraceae bacterium]|nr:arylsulfotransferase family protein [Solirubrobacteraceae bacterium]
MIKIRKRPAIIALLILGALTVPAQASAATVTISPLPGTTTALPATQISFLGPAASTLGSISVVGSLSGRHAGRLHAYLSIRGASFVPSKPFFPGEHVTVRAAWRPNRGTRVVLSDAFTVAVPATVPLNEFPSVPGKPTDVQGFQSEPQLHPPAVTVHQAAAAGSAPGYVFASPYLGPGQWGPMIFDSAGNLVWFRASPAGRDAADFRTQLYRGRNQLTWWQGKTVTFGYGLGEDVIADANYRTISVVRAGNGLLADEHEFLITAHGSAYVLAYSPVAMNLSAAGGPASGIALDGVIQQVDIHTGLVMWEWHSLDHVAITESYSKPPPPTATNGVFDYFHINSLDVGRHGELLISARNTWALYNLNSHTGALQWRLGGKRSSFTLGANVPFAYQHDARWLPNGDVSLFDDEGGPPVKPPSRGEIVRLDLKANTATLVQQLVRTSGPLITFSQGNSQTLPGGGWMVGWGGLPNMTEFDSHGQIVYDAQLPAGEFSYRSYRLPWAAQPTQPPAVLARSEPAKAPACPPGLTCPSPRMMVTVYASWNGATTVAFWQVLAGKSAAHLKPVARKPKTGFETAIQVTPTSFFQVRALSASGSVLGASKVVRPAP